VAGKKNRLQQSFRKLFLWYKCKVLWLLQQNPEFYMPTKLPHSLEMCMNIAPYQHPDQQYYPLPAACTPASKAPAQKPSPCKKEEKIDLIPFLPLPKALTSVGHSKKITSPSDNRDESPIVLEERKSLLSDFLTTKVPVKKPGKRCLGDVSADDILYFLQKDDPFYSEAVAEKRIIGTVAKKTCVAHEKKHSKKMSCGDIDITIYISFAEGAVERSFEEVNYPPKIRAPDGFWYPEGLHKPAHKEALSRGEYLKSWFSDKVLYAIASACYEEMKKKGVVPKELQKYIGDWDRFTSELIKLIRSKYLTNFYLRDEGKDAWMLISFGNDLFNIDIKGVISIEREWDILSNSVHISVEREWDDSTDERRLIKDVATLKFLEGRREETLKDIREGRATCNDPEDLKNGLMRCFKNAKKGTVYSFEDIQGSAT
jgi:hypothetical protein